MSDLATLRRADDTALEMLEFGQRRRRRWTAEVALRQWVLTFPFAWRRRLAADGALLGALTHLFVT